MFKRTMLTMLALGTMAIGSLAASSKVDAQIFRRDWYLGPSYTYYVPPSYPYYYAPPYRTWYRPYSYYVAPPYGTTDYYYSARPGIQVYYR